MGTAELPFALLCPFEFYEAVLAERGFSRLMSMDIYTICDVPDTTSLTFTALINLAAIIDEQNDEGELVEPHLIHVDAWAIIDDDVFLWVHLHLGDDVTALALRLPNTPAVQTMVRSVCDPYKAYVLAVCHGRQNRFGWALRLGVPPSEVRAMRSCWDALDMLDLCMQAPRQDYWRLRDDGEEWLGNWRTHQVTWT